MAQPWQNPEYERSQQQRRRRIFLLVLAPFAGILLVWLLSRGTGEKRAASASASGKRPANAVAAASRETVARDVARSGPAIDSATPTGTEPVRSVTVDVAERRQADDHFSAGRFRQAHELYNRLSTDPACRGRAAICLAQLNRWAEATPDLEAAAAALPGDFEVHKWLAMALYRQNELARALEQVQTALGLRDDAVLQELEQRIGKEIQVQRNYDDAQTWYFTVLFDGREHDEIKRTVLDILKSAHASIGKDLDFFPDQPITVILYTAKDFSDVTRAPEWAGGMFGQLDGKIRVPVRGAEGHEQALQRVLYHEYTHALVYALAPRCPFWLQEGLAQYFSGDEPAGVNQVIPLAALNGGFPRDARAAVVAYMESLQAVVDLVEERGLSRLRQLLVDIGAGSDLETAFSDNYGQPFSRWAAGWRPVKRDLP